MNTSDATPDCGLTGYGPRRSFGRLSGIGPFMLLSPVSKRPFGSEDLAKSAVIFSTACEDVYLVPHFTAKNKKKVESNWRSIVHVQLFPIFWGS